MIYTCSPRKNGQWAPFWLNSVHHVPSYGLHTVKELHSDQFATRFLAHYSPSSRLWYAVKMLNETEYELTGQLNVNLDFIEMVDMSNDE